MKVYLEIKIEINNIEMYKNPDKDLVSSSFIL